MKTHAGETMKSGTFATRKQAADHHWKMTKATDKRGNKVYKSIETVKEKLDPSMGAGEYVKDRVAEAEQPKQETAGMKKESVVARRRRRGTSVHGNMIDAKLPSLKKAMHIASDNDEFVKLIASDPTLIKALMAAIVPSPKIGMDVKADIHDLRK